MRSVIYLRTSFTLKKCIYTLCDVLGTGSKENIPDGAYKANKPDMVADQDVLASDIL